VTTTSLKTWMLGHNSPLYNLSIVRLFAKASQFLANPKIAPVMVLNSTALENLSVHHRPEDPCRQQWCRFSVE
jgi:hypothetical protein